MLNSPYTTPPFFSHIEGAFKTVSEWPSKIIEFGQDQNQRIIGFMEQLQGAASGAGGSLRDTEVRRTGGNIAAWIDSNQGLLLAAGLIAIAAFILRK